MALFISETNGVMEVREEQYSWTDTKRSWSYFDLSRGLQSSLGHQNAPLDREMDQTSRDWVVKHYVPRIAPYIQTPEERLKSPEAQQRRIDDEAKRRVAMNALFHRQAENDCLPFAEKCRLLKEEIGCSVTGGDLRGQRPTGA